MGRRKPTGGSRELARLIDGYGEYLIPDLLETHGIDLRDLFSETRPISPRWALMHIKHLKMTSAFVAELRGGQQFRGWDADRYLRVAEVDTLRELSHMYLVAHIDPKKHKPKPPDAWEIPDVRPKTNSPGSFASMALRHLNAEKKFKN